VNDPTLVVRKPEPLLRDSNRRAKRVLVGRDAKMIALAERLARVAYPAILERHGGLA
jgi:hypothetical protein